MSRTLFGLSPQLQGVSGTLRLVSSLPVLFAACSSGPRALRSLCLLYTDRVLFPLEGEDTVVLLCPWSGNSCWIKWCKMASAPQTSVRCILHCPQHQKVACQKRMRCLAPHHPY